jgi:hypothetical protein
LGIRRSWFSNYQNRIFISTWYEFFVLIMVYISVLLTSSFICQIYMLVGLRFSQWWLWRVPLLWDVTLCGLVEVHECFQGTYCLPPTLAGFLLGSFFGARYSGVIFIRNLVNFYQTRWCHIRENSTLHYICCMRNNL